jgi:hypothetical protein
MRTRFGRILLLLSTPLLALPLCAGQSGLQVFTGEVMDSLCAKNGSHDEMMDEMKSMGRDKATCTQKCIQLGGKYVLYDAAKKTVYNLDDPDKVEAFAGRKVRVSGTLEKNKIRVSSVQAAD